MTTTLIVVLLALAWLSLTWFAWTCRLPAYNAEAELAAQLERDWEAQRMAGDPPDNVVELRSVMR